MASYGTGSGATFERVIKHFFEGNDACMKAPNGNMFWEWGRDDGDRIMYSYGHHYPLAGIDGEALVCLVNSTLSTRTTERHKVLLRSGVRVLSVPCVLPKTRADHATNVAYLSEQASMYLDSMGRRRSRDRAVNDLKQAHHCRADASVYASKYYPDPNEAVILAEEGGHPMRDRITREEADKAWDLQEYLSESSPRLYKAYRALRSNGVPFVAAAHRMLDQYPDLRELFEAHRALIGEGNY